MHGRRIALPVVVSYEFNERVGWKFVYCNRHHGRSFLGGFRDQPHPTSPEILKPIRGRFSVLHRIAPDPGALRRLGAPILMGHLPSPRRLPLNRYRDGRHSAQRCNQQTIRTDASPVVCLAYMTWADCLILKKPAYHLKVIPHEK